MKSKKAFKEEVSPGLSIENSKCSTVELQEEVCSEKTEHTEWADLEGWNSMTTFYSMQSKLYSEEYS